MSGLNFKSKNCAKNKNVHSETTGWQQKTQAMLFR
jgi:hypothetical protein